MQGKRRNQMQESDQEFLYNSNEESSKILLPNKIQELKNSSSNLEFFIKEASHLSKNHSPNLFFEYCGKHLEWQQEPAAIQEFFQKRINTITRSRRIKKNWNKQDQSVLLWIVHQYCGLFNRESIQALTSEDWQQIASYIPGANGDSCMFRILSLKTYKLSEKKWSKQQEKILQKIVLQSQQPKWKQISEKLYNTNLCEDKIFRTAKQCKQHWNCYLNPKLKKGPWEIHEDVKLLSCIVHNKGSKKWAKLAKSFNGRTENALKNRFSLLVQNYIENSLDQLSELSIAKNILRKLEHSVDRQNQEQNHSDIRGHASDIDLRMNQQRQNSGQQKNDAAISQQIPNFEANIQNNLIIMNQPQVFPTFVNGFPFYWVMGKYEQ